MLAGATGMQLKCKFEGRIGGISRQSHQALNPPQAPKLPHRHRARPPQSPSQTPKPPLKKPRLTWGR